MAAHAEAGQWREALALMGQMPGVGLAVDVDTYNTALRAFVVADQLEWILSLFQDMPRVGLVPDVTTYVHVIAACESAGQWQLALRYFADMRGAGLQLDERACSAVLRACAQGDQWQWAVHAVTDLRAQGVTPARDTFEAAIAICRRCGQADWAESLSAQAREAPHQPPRPSGPARGPRTAMKQARPEGGRTSQEASRRARALGDPPGGPGAIKSALAPAVALASSAAVSKERTDMVTRVAKLSYSLKWRRFCDSYGSRKYDPEFHADSFLRAFLQNRRPGKETKPPIFELKETERESSPWLYKLKGLLLSNRAVEKFRWYAYCTVFEQPREETYFSELNPDTRDESFIQGFFEMLEAWPTDLADQGVEVDIGEYELLAMRVLEMQEYGTAKDRLRWQRFCTVVSGGKRHPIIHHDLQSLQQFFAEGAAADVEEEAEEPGDQNSAKEEPSEPRSIEDICWELAQYKDPSLLFQEAVDNGTFCPWLTPQVLDLHNLSVDVAKVACWTRLNELLLLPEHDGQLSDGLLVIVGKGLHSGEEGRKLAPSVHQFLTESFLFSLPPLDLEAGHIKLPAAEIRRVHKSHPYFVSEREKVALAA